VAEVDIDAGVKIIREKGNVRGKGTGRGVMAQGLGVMIGSRTNGMRERLLAEKGVGRVGKRPGERIGMCPGWLECRAAWVVDGILLSIRGGD
jgi:hypothetical protein